MMKINKIREMSSPELEKELVELKSELFKLRFSLATNGLDNPMKIKEVKKNGHWKKNPVARSICMFFTCCSAPVCPELFQDPSWPFACMLLEVRQVRLRRRFP